MLGCNSRQRDIHNNFDTFVMDDDFGFCGFISCMENHNVVQYKLPECDEFPSQYQYDSILVEISGIADWELENGQIQVRRIHGNWIVLFCCNHNEWDTLYFYTLDESSPIVKLSLDSIYDKVSPYMKYGVYCLYDGSGQELPLECAGDLLNKEAVVQTTEFKYTIRLMY